MPELPEVETIRRQLREILVGKKVVEIEVLNNKSFNGEKRGLLGKKVVDISRKAKVIEIVMESNLSVLVHLKMTGQLIFVDGKTRVVGGHPTADWVNKLPSKHTRIIWKFGDRSKLFFNDMRKFGWMKVVNSEKKVSGSVPDVVDVEFTKQYLRKVLEKQKKNIKVAILDQQLMGGIGNIYACDALFLAGIRPERRANSLGVEEVNKLHNAILEVINLGIATGGASAANYVDTKGMGGTYQDHFLVYKRDGEKCKNCRDIILKIKLGGRGTYYCPSCQC